MALAATLVAVIRPVPRPTGPEAVRGRRVFAGLEPPADAVTIAWEGQTFRAERGRDGWQVDGRAAGRPVVEAVDDMVETLARLRAIDAFRPREPGSFGLDAPRGTIEIRRGRRTWSLAVGGVNVAASAFYARRVGDARILQVGSGLESLVERVLYASRQRPEIGDRPRQRPEIG